MRLNNYEPRSHEGEEGGAGGPEMKEVLRDPLSSLDPGREPITPEEILPEAIHNIKESSGEELTPTTLEEFDDEIKRATKEEKEIESQRVIGWQYGGGNRGDHVRDIGKHYGMQPVPEAEPLSTRDQYEALKQDVEERWDWKSAKENALREEREKKVAQVSDKEQDAAPRVPAESDWHKRAIESDDVKQALESARVDVERSQAELRQEDAQAASSTSERVQENAKAMAALERFVRERTSKTKVQIERLAAAMPDSAHLLERVREFGERLNNIPKWQRFGLSVGLVASGMGAAALGGAATAAVIGAGALGWRMVASAGTYATLEAALTKWSGERSDARKKWNSAEAAVLAALVGGGALGQGISNVLDAATEPVLDRKPGVKGTITRSLPLETLAPLEPIVAPPLAEMAKESVAAPSVPHLYVVRPGDNLTKIIQSQILDKSGDLGRAGLANVTENILAEIRKDPAAFGVESGNVDLIHPGDSLDIGKIHEVLEAKRIGGEGLVEHARGVTGVAAPGTSFAPELLNTTEPSAPEGTFSPVADDIERSSVADKSSETPGSWPALELAVSEQFRSDLRGVFGKDALVNMNTLLDAKANDVIRQNIIEPMFGGFFTPTHGTLAGISTRDLEEMGKYLKFLSDKSGVIPQTGETTERFARRALGAIAIREYPELITTK